jgi:cystathionine beta-lyase
MLRKPALLPFSRGISSQDDSGVIRICSGETAFRSGRNIRVGAGDVLSSFHWHVNPFGVEAAIAAYNEGEDWLLELLDYLKGNYDYLCAFFRTHLPEIPVTKLEGTYLVWTDCRALHLPSDTLQTRLLETTGLWLNSGTMYGAEGEGFLRWNIACPRSVLQDALSRFKGFVDALTTEG